MTTWQEFYTEIRDPSWPECDKELEFNQLPDYVQRECIDVFGYIPGQFLKTSKLKNRTYPINKILCTSKL